MEELKRIEQNDKILLVDNQGNKELVKVRGPKNYKMHKNATCEIKGTDIIGQPFGTIIEITQSSSIVRNDLHSLSQDDDNVNFDDDEETKDNRNIKSGDKNQQLTWEDIEYMKTQGKGGKELIETILAGSKTFAEKQGFSKEKYLKKLKAKYLTYIELRYPTMKEICDYYFEQNTPTAINLRFDTLGYMTHLAGIHFKSKVILLDNTRGILPSIALERVTEGSVTKVSLFDQPNPDFFNEMPALMKNPNIDHNNLKTLLYPAYLRNKEGEQKADFEALESSKATACIIAHNKHTPVDLFKIAQPYLSTKASQLVVFSPFIEPLAELEMYLRENKLCLLAAINELWMREHQVLPKRTHPEMLSESAHSGFILTTTIIR